MIEKLGCKSNEVRLENKCYPIGKEKNGVTIQKARMQKGNLIVEGKNREDQRFVEIHRKDKIKGMILKVPYNDFWYVLKGTVMVFKKEKSGGIELPLGSKKKNIAFNQLKKELKL